MHNRPRHPPQQVPTRPSSRAQMPPQLSAATQQCATLGNSSQLSANSLQLTQVLNSSQLILRVRRSPPLAAAAMLCGTASTKAGTQTASTQTSSQLAFRAHTIWPCVAAGSAAAPAGHAAASAGSAINLASDRYAAAGCWCALQNTLCPERQCTFWQSLQHQQHNQRGVVGCRI
jgi:hypothetical protein